MKQGDLDILWTFVRGDLAIPEFETWLYAHEELEKALGSALHFELISTDYRNRDNVFAVREKLHAVLRKTLKCECLSFSDLAVVPMGCDGLDERFFASIDEVQRYGRDLWWLHLSRCRVCGQNWMIAQEERIYDDYFLKRLTAEEASQIVNYDKWPNDFLTYEKVLKVGHKLSKACRFYDPMSHALVYTIQELRRDRPDITTAEIAVLIGVTIEHAEALIQAT